MPKARLTVLGLYQYDSSIFDFMYLPLNLSHEILINNILLECSELEILYPDSDFFKFAVKVWSEKEVGRWEHLYRTTQYEYDPIENYNRYEDYTDTNESVGKSTISGKNNSETKVAAFDSPEYKESELNTTGNENRNDSSASGTLKHTAHLHGNIGVTTTQEMIVQERKAILNLYNVIIEDFKNRFCILIY